MSEYELALHLGVSERTLYRKRNELVRLVMDKSIAIDEKLT